MISTVVFDMDGVIVDSEPVHYEIEMSVLQELGVHLSEKEYLRYVGTTSKSMWADIISRYNLSITADEAIRKGRDQYHHRLYHTDQPKLIEGTARLIDGLHKTDKKLVLASSSTIENIEIVLQKHNLKHYFDHVVGGDQVTNGKPDPEIFLLASKLAKTLPSQCLVIEDSRNGVAAAKAAGMRVIGFNNPSSNNQLLYDADLVVNDMSDLNEVNIFDKLQEVKAS